MKDCEPGQDRLNYGVSHDLDDLALMICTRLIAGILSSVSRHSEQFRHGDSQIRGTQ